MLKRPSHTDTEEDLLKFQKEFLASKTQSSVKVLKLGENVSSVSSASVDQKDDKKKNIAIDRDVVTLTDAPSYGATTSVPPRKKSRFKTAKNQSKLSKDEHTPVQDAEVELDQADCHISKVLADIVERDLDSTPVYYPQATSLGGFPKVLHRGQITPSSSGTTSGKKLSLFAQQFAKSSAQAFGLPEGIQSIPVENVHTTVKKNSTGKKSSIFASKQTSSIVTGSGLVAEQAPVEAKQIHLDNISQLEDMTETEILTEQKQLLQSLDPNIVAFLKRKSKPAAQDHDKVMSAAVPQPHPTQPDNMEQTHIDTTPGPDSNMQTSAIEPSGEWVHMDKVEPEKIEWMTDLPEPAPADNQTGKPARFDFHGKLVAMDATLPTHLGLHHHGDEPERAGYTIAELFHLARSAHMQQRTLAINTLAKIIQNTRQGRFVGHISTALIPAMVEGGLVFVARWALDDKTENTMSAAVNILHAILVSPHDEDGLDEVFCWYRGHEVSSMCPVSDDTHDTDEKLSDPDLLKQDMIKGLLQMSILPRLRYIIEVWRPGSTVVIQVLEILIRLCRHSTQVAYEVLKCPRLMNAIIKEFLPWKIPENWPEPLFSVYGLPCPSALKLMRVLCTNSKHMASHLLCNYPVMDNVMLYLSQAQHQGWELHRETHKLVIESFRIWRICVAYGLAVTHYHEYYTMLMEMLQKTCQLSYTSDRQSVQLGVSLISLLQSVLLTAATSTKLSLKLTQQARTDVQTEVEHTEHEAVPDIDWSHVAGLYQPVQLSLQQTAGEFCQLYFDERQDLSLAAASLNFVATWLGQIQSMASHNAIETIEQIEILCEKCLIPVINSRGFSAALSNIRKYSVILCSETASTLECLKNLPDLGSLIGDKMSPCPILHKDSSMNFVLALVRVLDALKIHKGIAEKIYPMLLNNTELIQYIRQVCKAKRSTLVNNHFAQFENRLQQLFINMATFPGISIDVSLYHHVALYVLTHIHSGSEFDIHQLLSTAIFCPTLWGDLDSTVDPHIANLDDQLKLNPPATIVSATQQEITVNKQFLRNDVMTNLVSVRSTYLLAFGGSQKALELSRSRSDSSCSFPETFMLGSCGQLVVPVDWVFLPLIEIYNSTCDITSQNIGERSVSRETTSTVTNCLRYVYCIEAYRPGCLDTVPYSLRLSRLMCTFLAGTDLFLEPSVQAYLAALLHVYCKHVALDRMNFSEPIPGVASFYDLYVMLLEQFSAVSFGDSVFGSYILLPIQQRHALIFRKAIWGEYADAIRSLHIAIKQVLMPLEKFVEPEETNLELLRLYYQALVSQTVTSRRTPLPYLIAVHHVNRFMYSQHHQHISISHSMIKNLLQAKDKILQHHLLYYKNVDKDGEFGMALYTDLPSSRQGLLDSLT